MEQLLGHFFSATSIRRSNSMDKLYVRRSGRLSNQKKRNQWEDDDGVIDLTTEEWDRACEEFINFEQNEGSETINEESEKIGAACMKNVVEEDVGNVEDNIEKVSGKDKMDAGTTEDRKAERVAHKQKLVALAEKIKKQKVAKQVVRKGKMAALVKKSKKQSVQGNTVEVKRKRAEQKANGKKKNLDVGTERSREAFDGVSSDDDFVSSKKVKMSKADGNNRKHTSATKDKSFVEKEKSNVNKTGAKDKVKHVDKLHSRNPPNQLFLVIAKLSAEQKQSVIEIGFGKLLDFKIKGIPTRLAYWLLDQFDEEACCLKLNGKEIEINRELVSDVLGVPLGEVHIDAADEANYRNPLTREWKAQFPKTATTVKRYFASEVATTILQSRKGGWMFKINFLVLLFTIIGEGNQNNTVNLRFLPCISDESDILKMDWCTYTIECLIRTKIHWNRKSHFNGPIILLLVLYANSFSPIKWCTSDVLMTLENEKFPNDDGNDPEVVQEPDDEGFGEEHVRENAEFGDGEYRHYDVPTDVEGMKKFVAAYLQRAAEMVESADNVLDEGLFSHPDDAGFVELKELRYQMFSARTFSPKPYGVHEAADKTYNNCHTPCNGEKQHEDVGEDGAELPFTQVAIQLSDRAVAEFYRTNEPIPTRLNFDEGEDLDLNVTQPPATQGKEVGNGDNTDSQETTEFKTPAQPKGESPMDRSSSRGLSRFGREYWLKENKSLMPVCLEPEPLNVVEPHIPQRRPKRHVILPEKMRSPNVDREVSLLCGIFPHENRVADCIFSGRLTETDVVFQTDYCDGPRCMLETLYPGIKIASGAIDMFTYVLNDAERARNKQTTTRLFCHTAMVSSDMLKWDHLMAADKFEENMNLVLSRSVYNTLDAVEMVFFPIISDSHFYITCMNMKHGKIEYLDNIIPTNTDPYVRYDPLGTKLVCLFEEYLLRINHPRYDQMAVAEQTILTLGCRTTNNYTDCGVFAMRHMETYRGEGDRCCLKKEGPEQRKQINELRYKYVAKILLADCNKAKSKFEQETHAFKTLPVEEKKRLKNEAFGKIRQRVAHMLN